MELFGGSGEVGGSAHTKNTVFGLVLKIALGGLDVVSPCARRSPRSRRKGSLLLRSSLPWTRSNSRSSSKA